MSLNRDMDPIERLRAGRLEDALAEVQALVRGNPAKAQYRVFLVQVLAVLGQWDRALNQLKVLGELDSTATAMATAYREAIRCERMREEVFCGRARPLLLGQPDRWMALLLEAQRLTAVGEHVQAEAIRAEALELAPGTRGAWNGEAFDWIADADSRLGPMLEAIVAGKYYWIPFDRLRSVKIDPPADLRDLVWAPAELTLANGGSAVAFIPSRYPGSENEAAPLRLARRTEWKELSAATFVGLGQRMLATSAGEHPLLELRTLTLEPPVNSGAPDDGPEAHG